jgi:serine/threonine-protein kinase/endoribonuclease IRE1
MTSVDGFSKNSDTFSCGLVLYYILSAQRHPFSPDKFPFKDVRKIEDNILNGEMESDWDKCISSEATDLLKKMLRKDGSERPTPTSALAHPLFWSKSKKKDFLIAVGNQPEFEFPSSKTSLPKTDVEKDLDSKTSFETIVERRTWDNRKYDLMAKFCREMTKRRTYDTQSVVDLVRLIRNAYAHFSTLTRPSRKMLLDNFAYLDYFPNLVMEVYKVISTHGWDSSRKDIKDALNK